MELWKKSASSIFVFAIVAFAIYFVSDCFMIAAEVADTYPEGILALIIISSVFALTAFAFMIVYVIKMGAFAKSQHNEEDKTTIDLMRLAFLLAILAGPFTIVFFNLISELIYFENDYNTSGISLFGYMVGGLATVVGFCLLAYAANKYRSSKAIGKNAKEGAKLLLLYAMIVGALQYVSITAEAASFGVISSFLSVFSTIGSAILLIMAWGKIKADDPNVQ